MNIYKFDILDIQIEAETEEDAFDLIYSLDTGGQVCPHSSNSEE